MKYKELKEMEDCNECPLFKNEICPGGTTSGYGGEPIEPPCCNFDDETDLDEWVEDCFDGQRRIEAYEDKKIKEQKEKERINKIKQDKRRKAQYYCWEENHKIKGIRKKIKSLVKLSSFVNSFASAVNITNSMFGYEERVKPKSNIEIELEKLNADLEIALNNKKMKLKEYYKLQKEVQK